MRKSVLLLVFTASAVLAQQATPPPPRTTNRVEQIEAPSYSDLYCSGFMTKEAIGRSNFVAGGKDTPDATLYGTNETVFLNGSGYQVDQLYSIVRELRDLNRYESFPGQQSALNETGQVYGDMGRIRVLQTAENGAIARVEFSCQPISPGDLVIPFQERPPVSYRQQKVAFEQFPASPGKLSARIVLSKDFDMFVATGSKVYINAGSDKGIKVGDYFRAVRGYRPGEMDPAEELSYKAPDAVMDMQKNAPTPAKAGADLPRRAVGEMIVLCVTPSSSTAMITLSLGSIKVGDQVDLEAPPE